MCDCLRQAIKRQKLAAIPPEYQGLDLATLKPDTSRSPYQAALFATLHDEPQASLVLTGTNGSGKTLAGWLAYRRAIEAGMPAVGMSCIQLIEQYRRWQFDGAMPAITPEQCRQERERRFIFLDEIDKARPTEFAAEAFFGLIDAVYSFRHQLVVTSNEPIDRLAEHWSRGGVTMGASIVRRLTEIHDGILIEM